jgi:hypothetical protein
VLQYDAYGEVDEDYLDRCKIRLNIGHRVEEIMRNAKSLHLYRANVITHESIVEKRELERQQNCDVKLHKMQEDNDKHHEKMHQTKRLCIKFRSQRMMKGN